MKITILMITAIISAAFFAGCKRFDAPQSVYYDLAAANDTMTLQEANQIVSSYLAVPPSGRRPQNPGDRFIGSNVTSIRLRNHKRTGYCLVEVMKGPRAFLKFYTLTRNDAEKFAKAVWRMKREFGQNSIHSR